MKLFVYEYITSGALVEETLPTSLAEEGDAMLSALLTDLLQIDAFQISLLRDTRLDPISAHPRLNITSIDSPNDYSKQWQQHLNDNKFAILIAPESDTILVEILEQANNYPIRVLGCTLKAAQLCSDKLALSEWLQQHQFTTPDTQAAKQWLQNPQTSSNGFVVKPFDGAGCIDTFMFASVDQTRYFLQQQADVSPYIVQPYVEGDNMSISAYIDDGAVHILGLNQQVIERKHDQLTFTACSAYQGAYTYDSAQNLVEQLAKDLSGLQGYIGIDLIVNEQQATIIEINPRLTTGYLNVRQSPQGDLAALIFNTIQRYENN